MVCLTVQHSTDGEPPSWCIIELQGAIERLVEPEADRAVDLGTLVVPPHVRPPLTRCWWHGDQKW